MSTFYRLTPTGEQCVINRVGQRITMCDELYADVIDGTGLLNVPEDIRWLAEIYVDDGYLVRVEVANSLDCSMICYAVSRAHNGFFSVQSGDKVLAILPLYGIARQVACYCASQDGGYSDVLVCAAPEFVSPTHMTFAEFI